MVVGRRDWDTNIICDIFNERDMNTITNTRLKEDETRDVIYWKLKHTGLYIVMSAYRMLQERRLNHGVQKLLWKIKAPPKVLNLVWRALIDFLPTLVELQYKHVLVQVRCMVCGNDNETITHALIQFQFARQCWRILNINIQPIRIFHHGYFLF